MKLQFTPEKNFLRDYKLGGKNPFFLIAGPCVIENRELLNEVAPKIKKICNELNILFFFKSSYDKANRSSIHSFRGPGLEEGVSILKEIKKEHDILILTDVHLPEEVEKVSEVADMIQIPAFLCRQTDLIVEASKTKKWLNIKKGQFVAPMDVCRIVEKVHSSGSDKVTICERGYSFGYNNLVVDMRGIEIIRAQGIHVVMDTTHSVQLPGSGEQSGGQREMIFPLARAAAAVGVDGFFMEVHPDPSSARSDSTNQLFLKDLFPILRLLLEIDALSKGRSI